MMPNDFGQIPRAMHCVPAQTVCSDRERVLGAEYACLIKVPKQLCTPPLGRYEKRGRLVDLVAGPPRAQVPKALLPLFRFFILSAVIRRHHLPRSYVTTEAG